MDLNIKDTMKAVLICLKAGLVPMLWGPPGIGKTAIIETIAAALQAILKHDPSLTVMESIDILLKIIETKTINIDLDKFDKKDPAFQLAELTGSTAMLDDLTGLPKNTDQNTMTWTRPEGLLDPEAKGILFIDEMTDTIALSISKGFYTITREHRSKIHLLSKDVLIACAGNRPSDGSGSTMPPSALITRLVHIGVCCAVPDFGSDNNARSILPATAGIDKDNWIQWATNNKLNPLTIGFIKSFEQYIYSYQSIPRTLEMASKILNVYCNPDKILHALLSGTIGPIPGNDKYGYIKVASKMPSLDSIISDPQNAPIPDDKSILHALTCGLLYRTDNGNFDSIMDYAKRLDLESQTYLIISAINQDASLSNNRKYMAWYNDNADILGSVSVQEVHNF